MSYIFINALGISELLSRILAACGSVDYLIFACLAYFVIERYGRRKVMMWSAAACSICWICISIALGLSEKGGNSYVLGSVAVAFFFVFFASFGMGVLGGEYTLTTAGDPYQLIWKTCSTLAVPHRDQRPGNEDERRVEDPASNAANPHPSASGTTLTPPTRRKSRNGHQLDLQLRRSPSHAARNRKPGLQILDHLGNSLPLSLPPSVDLPSNLPPQATICFAFIPITYLFYPETANRTLEDIDRFFETNPPLIIAGNKLATQLARPQIYEEQDAEIWRQVEKSGEKEKEKEEGMVVGVERV